MNARKLSDPQADAGTAPPPARALRPLGTFGKTRNGRPTRLRCSCSPSIRNRLSRTTRTKDGAAGRLLRPALALAALQFSLLGAIPTAAAAVNNPVRQLAEEVSDLGWIVFCARAEAGDWDLFLCRPDGSQRRSLTVTPGFNEGAPQFSRDGRQLLYRRLPRREPLEGNRYGEQGALVIARSDGSEPRVLGAPGEYAWASFNPDATQVACLSLRGIFLVDLATGRVLRRLERHGFFQQLTWSPDGRWLTGVANAFGVAWSVARLDLETGAANAINKIDCCTPDWFPDSRRVIFSWRPPGDRPNAGYGWTQLWMAEATGASRALLYGEDGRHVYGGHVSPDERYVLFTGNFREDGDPANAGAPMGLMRLRDAPIVRGLSPGLRRLYPNAKDGPVLTLPVGWEPAWTASNLPAQPSGAMPLNQVDSPAPNPPPPTAETNTASLARELHERGSLVCSAKTAQGDWDLFLLRPDGTERRPITRTPGFNEAGARFSPDGRRLLYYRLPKAEPVDNNTYGTHELVLADADGGHPVICGRNLPWASWGPRSDQLACLTPQSIRIVALPARQVVHEFPRKGFVSQLVWSPDGTGFAGTANGLGAFWTIGRFHTETGQLTAVSEVDRYNCTPDWWPDSRALVYARGIIPERGGRAELWLATADGTRREVLYAEAGRHIYGACPSPDGRYVLFTRSVDDLGQVDNSQTTLAIIRYADTPMMGDSDPGLKQRLPHARHGPRLDLGPGWEPHWTAAEIPRLPPRSYTHAQ